MIASRRHRFVFALSLYFVTCSAMATVPDVADTKGMDNTVEGQPIYEDDPSLGGDLKRFGEEVANKVDQVVKKNAFQMWGDPWTIQGIPLIFPSTRNGFNLGLRLLLDNMRRTDPHKLEMEAQVLTSDKGRYKYFLRMDVPHAFDGKFRITGRISYDRDIGFPFFGLGNETPIDNIRFDRDDVLYQNIQAGPGLNLQFLRHLGRNWRIGPVAGLKWTTVTAPSGSILESSRPVGITGGRTHYLGLAVVYDTLDFEPYPTAGDYHEVYLSLYNKIVGSDYNFLRSTYTFRKFIRLHRDLTFAHRTLFEVLSGDVPFYELTAVGGSNSSIGFGGDRFIRGYQANRFVDHIKMSLGFELRWDPIEFMFADQDLIIGLVPFVDLGRVWDRLLPLDLTPIHASAGWGTRIVWNRRFIIRTDFAANQEGTSLYLELGSSF